MDGNLSQGTVSRTLVTVAVMGSGYLLYRVLSASSMVSSLLTSIHVYDC